MACQHAGPAGGRRHAGPAGALISPHVRDLLTLEPLACRFDSSCCARATTAARLGDRELHQQQPIEGELECYTADDPHLRRIVRIAKLTRTADARRPELIPSLYDADIVTLGNTGAVITGVERLPASSGVVEFAQSWWVRFL